MDEGTDTGPIIMQKCVDVLDDDTPETLAARILEVEHEILPKSVTPALRRAAKTGRASRACFPLRFLP